MTDIRNLPPRALQTIPTPAALADEDAPQVDVKNGPTQQAPVQDGIDEKGSLGSSKTAAPKSSVTPPAPGKHKTASSPQIVSEQDLLQTFGFKVGKHGDDGIPGPDTTNAATRAKSMFGLGPKASDAALVKKMQAALLKQQNLLAKVYPDLGASFANGQAGRVTTAAILRFQSDNKLKTDGILGPVTEKALAKAAKAAPAAPAPAAAAKRPVPTARPPDKTPATSDAATPKSVKDLWLNRDALVQKYAAAQKVGNKADIERFAGQLAGVDKQLAAQYSTKDVTVRNLWELHDSLGARYQAALDAKDSAKANGLAPQIADINKQLLARVPNQDPTVKQLWQQHDQLGAAYNAAQKAGDQAQMKKLAAQIMVVNNGLVHYKPKAPTAK